MRQKLTDGSTYPIAVISAAKESLLREQKGALATSAKVAQECFLYAVVTGLPFQIAYAQDTVHTRPIERCYGLNFCSPDLGEDYSYGSEIDVKVSTALHISEQLEKVRTALERFRGELIAWHSQLERHHFEGLTKRLEYLFEDEPEQTNSQALPSMDSFRVLLAFLAHYPELKTPSIGFNRDGIFSGTWIGDKKLRLTLDFISLTSIRWIFVDSRSGINNALTGAGIVTLEILVGTLEAYKAWEWMKK